MRLRHLLITLLSLFLAPDALWAADDDGVVVGKVADSHNVTDNGQPPMSTTRVRHCRTSQPSECSTTSATPRGSPCAVASARSARTASIATTP